jgi:hypothetical protein
MARESAPETAVDRLVRYLLDAPPGAGAPPNEAAVESLAGELAGWLAASARFRTFVEVHRDKIRKKLRGAAEWEARLDVRAELRTARLLLADKRIELAFEAYGSGKRGPDFTVAFRGERSFNLEVTRLRRPPDAASYGGPLMAKLLQLPPSVPNALLISIDGEGTAVVDIGAATRALRDRADRKDEAFFLGRGFEGTRGFYERLLRLGRVFVLGEIGAGEDRASLWVNRSARIMLPPRAARACLAAFRADGTTPQ